MHIEPPSGTSGKPSFELAPSPAETSRFGFRVFRAKCPSGVSAREIQRSIVESAADLTILRIQAGDSAQVAPVARCGFPYVVADTLVRYESTLVDRDPAPLRNRDISFKTATLADSPELVRLVRSTFENYRNHYDASPYLKRSDFLDGYQEWALGFADGMNSCKRAWLVQRGGQNIAFCTCEASGSRAEGILFGVDPRSAGGGIYGDMIRFTQSYYKAIGCNTMSVSTQIENTTVQHVWVREGFRLVGAETTIHINSFLSHSVLPASIEDLIVTDADSADFGAASGDHNPIHFVDEAARRCGFHKRIAHGVYVLAKISKQFGTAVPGDGTIIRNLQAHFLAPVYVGERYSLRYSFPLIDRTRGLFKAVVQLCGPDGQLCAYCTADLSKVPA